MAKRIYKYFKVRIIKVLLGIFIFSFSNHLIAQNSATSSVFIAIVQPVGIKTTSDLNFASMHASKGGEVTITPSSERIASGGVILSSEENASPATIEISTEPGFAYAVTLPNDKYIIYNGTDSMIIDNFTSDFNKASLLSEGSQTLHVGATLVINPDQSPGNYVNTTAIQVAINYN